MNALSSAWTDSLLRSSANNQSTIVDATNGSRFCTVPSSRVLFDSLGSDVAAIGGDAVRFYDRATGEPKALIESREVRPIAGAQISPDGRVVLVNHSNSTMFGIDRDPRVSVHERLTGRLLVSISGLEWPVDFSPDGSVAIFGARAFSTVNWREILPSGGRRFPSVLRFRASLGRFLKTGNLIWDEPTELKLASHASEKPRLTGMHDGLGPVHSAFQPGIGFEISEQPGGMIARSGLYSWTGQVNRIVWIDRDTFASDPNIVKLWAEVLTLRQLEGSNITKLLSEAEWEDRRLRLLDALPTLASKLLNTLAHDRQHWVREVATTVEEAAPAERDRAFDRLIAMGTTWWKLDARGRAFLKAKRLEEAARDFLAANKLAGDWYRDNLPPILDESALDRLVLAARPETLLREVWKLGPEVCEIALHNLANVRRDSKHLLSRRSWSWGVAICLGTTLRLRPIWRASYLDATKRNPTGTKAFSYQPRSEEHCWRSPAIERGDWSLPSLN